MSLFRFLRPHKKDGADVAVIGSGLTAGAIALELARRRCRVSVHEPPGPPGPPPPPGLGLVTLGLGRPYDRVVGALGHAPALSIWEAGRQNRERVREFLRKAGHHCALQARGSFLLSEDRVEAESLANSEDMLREDDFSGEFLDHYMLETHFDLSGFTGAYWAADDLELDLSELAAAVASAARSAGALFRTTRVLGLDAGESGVVVITDEAPAMASRVVVADDEVARSLLPDLGPGLAGSPAPRLSAALPSGASLPGAARTADGRIAWQVSPGGITLAAQRRTSPSSEPRDAGRLDALLSRLHATPGSERRWTENAGLAVDGLPMVGPVAGKPLVVACGLGPLEASLAFAAARWVGDAILTGRDSTPEPFRVNRAAQAVPV